MMKKLSSTALICSALLALTNPVKYKAWFIKNKADADLAEDYADEV